MVLNVAKLRAGLGLGVFPIWKVENCDEATLSCAEGRRFRRVRRVSGVRSRRATRARIVNRVMPKQAGNTRQVRRVRAGLRVTRKGANKKCWCE